MNHDKGRYWDEALGLVTGCNWDDRPAPSKCRNCWAAKMVRARPAIHRAGVPWCQVLEHPERLDKVLRRKQPTVYLSLTGEFFHPAVSDDIRRRCVSIIRETPQHTYLISTTRWREMERWVRWVSGADLQPRLKELAPPWPPNLYILLSAGNQEEANEAMPRAMRAQATAPGLKVVLNLEPIIGPVVISRITGLSGVIVGGETGSRARPLNPAWVRSVRDQCAEAKVPFYFKGWGGEAGRILDGREHNELAWV